MIHSYVTLDSHPTLPKNTKIGACFTTERHSSDYYIVGDGFNIMTKKEVELDLKNGFIVEDRDLRSYLYGLVDKAMPSYIGGDFCVIRDLKVLLEEKHENNIT